MNILNEFSYYYYFFLQPFPGNWKQNNSSIKYQQIDKADTDAKNNNKKNKKIVVFKNHKWIPLIKFDEKFLNYINFLA